MVVDFELFEVVFAVRRGEGGMASNFRERVLVCEHDHDIASSLCTMAQQIGLAAQQISPAMQHRPSKCWRREATPQ